MTQFALNALRFEDVRRAVVTFLKENNQYSGELDYDGSNIGYFIDVVSYYTMLQSYQNSLISNNIFIDTTEIRKNAISIAKGMGYRPKRKISSRFTGSIEYYGDTTASPSQTFVQGDSITIPARTLFTSGSYTFINKVPITLTYVNDVLLSGDFIVYEGTFRTVTIYGTGEKYQEHVISSEDVENDSLSVYVRTSNTPVSNNVKWEQVDSFFTSTEDEIYFVEEDIVNEYRPKILFGDGLIGQIPLATETITIEYLETVGDVANGETSLSFSGTPNATATYGSGSTFTFDVNNLVIDLPANQVSYGGRNNESLTSIQFNAPRFYTAGGRAVTKDDLEVLLSDYESTLKYYNVLGGNILFPNDSTKLGIGYITAVPYFSEDNSFLNNESIYLNEVEENEILPDLISKSVISTIRRFIKPTYIYMTVNPYIEVPVSYSDEEVESTISTAYTAILDYRDNNLKGLGKTFRSAQLISSLTNTLGVTTADIDITHYFAITGDSFYNSKSSMMFLPILYDKTATGQILYDDDNNPVTENFIKKREDIIDELNESRSSTDQYTQFTLPISNSSIYGALRHKNSNRYLYNIDVSRIEILSFQEEGSTGQKFISYTSKSFTDSSGVQWTSNLYENGTDSWQIQLNGRHIAQLRKTGSTFSIYQPDKTFLSNTVGVVSETNSGVTTWMSIDTITETDENNNTETYYSISFLLSNTTYTDVRIYGETKLGESTFDAETFTWSWTNTATLLDDNNNDVTFSPLPSSTGDEENFLNVVYADATTDILLSVKNARGTFSLNNFNEEFLVDFDQRNDFKLEQNYTLERNDISDDATWEASTEYTLEENILTSSGYIVEVTTAGTSGSSEPSWPSSYTYGDTVTDGSVTWTLVSNTTKGSNDETYVDYEFSTISAPTAAYEQTVTLNALKGFKITVPNTKNNTEVTRTAYQDLGLSVDSTTSSGIGGATYNLLINGVNYAVVVGSSPANDTYTDLVDDINNAIGSADFTASITGTSPAQDIRISRDTNQTDLDVLITDGVTNGLLTALSTTVDTAVSGYGIDIGQMTAKWFHLYSANNATHYYVWLKNGVHETSTFTCDGCGTGGGLLTSEYFTFETVDSSGAVSKYYAWYDINNTGTDPAVAGHTGIEVSLATNTTAENVAIATKTAIDLTGIDVTITRSTDELEFENDHPGAVDNAASVTITGGTFVVTRDLVGANATDPQPDVIVGESWSSLPVLIRTGDTYKQIASKLATAINAYDDFSASVGGVDDNEVTVTLAEKGKSTIEDGDSTSKADTLLYKGIFGETGYSLLGSPFNDSSTAFTFSVDTGSGQVYAGFNIDVNIERIEAGDYLTFKSTTNAENTGTFLVKSVGTTTRYDLYSADGTLLSKDVGATCTPTGTDVIKTTTVPDGTLVIYNKGGVQALDGVGDIEHYKVTSGTYGNHIVYMQDIFHNVSVGTLNYTSGRLTFEDNIKGYTDYETSSPTSIDTKGYYSNQHTLTRSLKSVFDNYGKNWDTATNKVDIIKIVPVDQFSNAGVYIGQQNDFDVLFNQCLQINISNPQVKK